MFQAGPTCVNTELEASTYYAMQQAGSIVTLNGVSYSTSIISVYPTYHVIKYTNVATGSAVWASPAFFAQPCIQVSNPFILSMADGALLSGAVLLVWATAWIYKQFSRVITGGSPE